jgi:imidazolonepropionase-like amidohydrolase
MMRRWLISGLPAAIVIAVAGYGFAFWTLRDPHPAPIPATGILAITGARIYASPDAPVIADGTVLLRDGKIAAVGEQVDVPAGAELLPCDGCVVTAGFWNAHVHFTERKWSGAEWKQGAALQAQLEDMLTSRGFTTVVDTGSNLRDTIPIRRRIERGGIAGPKIYTAGSAQYPPHGIPYYLRDSLPRWLLFFLPQPGSPSAAAKVEEQNIRNGADLLKLFTGSYIARGTVLPMPLKNAQAAVEVAHRHGQLAFAHESNLQGLQVARDSGVDVLAHAVDTADGVDDAVLNSVIAKHMAMIPTLKMFRTTVTTNPKYLDPIYAQVGRFHTLGGDLIFGTDVGYMTDYDTTGEFQALERSGLAGKDILRMLTTAPAERFGVSNETGSIETGKSGDLVLLARDPMQDVTAFAAVQATIRGGRVIWRKP